MKELIKKTRLYQEIQHSGENFFSQAVLAIFPDAFYLKDYLKECAKLFFGAKDGMRDAELIDKESFPDLLIFPEKKYTVEACGRIQDESLLLPVEKKQKLFLLSDFDTASALVQNKLLKILEEMPDGVGFLIGASSERSILPTILSRSKLIFEPPFSEEDIYAALKRNYPQNSYLREGAFSANGNYHTAEILCAGEGEQFRLAKNFLERPCAETALDAEKSKSPRETIAAMRAILRNEYFLLRAPKYASKITSMQKYPAGVLLFALKELDIIERDLSFNANFSSCLLAFSLKVKEENEKWKKLP